MEKKYLEVLEYPKVLERVADHAAFSAGRERVLALSVSTDLQEVRRRQKETTEARRVLSMKMDVSLGGVHDVRPFLDRAARGARLLPHELLDVQNTLSAAQKTQRTLARLGSEFPLLSGLATSIEGCHAVSDEISRCITPKAEVADGASPELARIRSQLGIARDRLLERLERILTNPENQAYLQEALITQRGGRYVIPIRAECRGNLPGLVHDESSSGATLFIEPLATVDLNNEWREWQLREEREVNRVLDTLSRLIAEEAKLIQRTVEIMAELDLIFARAHYAEELNAVEPNLAEFMPKEALDEGLGIYHPGTRLRLLQARHPLLPRESVVPIDMYMRLGANGYFVVLITGPNTGGKTVALKTTGLLCLMAQAGMHIPAAEGSTIVVFDGIYADIGDEQSIEQSLSTFSSHMSNIIHILSQSTERSLVLLDELGAGTDPLEGSALGRSILVELVRRSITTVATTHHPELKIFGQSQLGVVNASVEFDPVSLAPTYKLSIGMPGRSNALAIAERLGLPQWIVQRAESFIDPSLLQTDELLTQVKLLRDEAGRELEEAKERRTLAEKHESELARRLAEIEAQREEAIVAARQEARAELELLQKELQQLRSDVGKVRVAQTLQEMRETLARAEEVAAEAEEMLTTPAALTHFRDGELEPGDKVWVRSMSAQGVVTGLEEGHAEVVVGNIRLRVSLDDLDLREQASPTTPGIAKGPWKPSAGLAAATTIRPELHLRGKRIEEAIPELERYLDEAYLAGLRKVRIVHGKGTGTLRRMVREELSRHPLVSGMHVAPEREGGGGVTIAEFVQQ